MTSIFTSHLFPENSHQCSTYWQEAFIRESLLIQKQEDLISQLNHKCTTKIFNKNSTLCSELTDVSFQASNYSIRINRSHPNKSHSLENLLLLSDDHEQDKFLESLEEIKQRCTKNTYNLIRDKMFLNCQDLMEARNEKKLEREIRYNQQLVNKIQKLTQQKIELLNKVSNLQSTKVTGGLQVRHRKRSAQLSQKFDTQQLLINCEKVIIHKQKMQTSTKKFIEHQLQIMNQERGYLEECKVQILRILTDNNNAIEASKKLKQMDIEIKQILTNDKIVAFNSQSSKLIEEYQQEIELMIGELREQIIQKKKLL